MAYLKQTFQMLDEGVGATSDDNLLQKLAGPYAGRNRLEVVNPALWRIAAKKPRRQKLSNQPASSPHQRVRRRNSRIVATEPSFT